MKILFVLSLLVLIDCSGLASANTWGGAGDTLKKGYQEASHLLGKYSPNIISESGKPVTNEHHQLAPLIPISLVRGAPDAKITLLEYGDFDCPHTARMHRAVLQMIEAHPQTVRFVFKMKPLLFHPQAMPAALRWAAVLLHEPDKAWPYFDALFEGKLAGRLGADYYHEIEQKLGIDSSAIQRQIDSGVAAAIVQVDAQEFDERGLQGTPTFFVNDEQVPSHPDFLEDAIRRIEQGLQAR